jgi:hypothetical protein
VTPVTTPAARAAETTTAVSRSTSMPPRAHSRRRFGLKVRPSSASPAAVRRSRTGGLPIHDDPLRALCGAADSTATSPFLGTDRPGAAMPELPRNARRPTLARATRIQPPPSSYGATIVSSARNAPSDASIIDGIPTTVDASTCLPIRAPSSRSQPGVKTLE